jgi:uridylate kinase
VLLEDLGRALMGEQNYGIDVNVARSVPRAESVHRWVQVRSLSVAATSFAAFEERGQHGPIVRDYIGCCDGDERRRAAGRAREGRGPYARMSAIDIRSWRIRFIRRRADQAFEKDASYIFAAGTGNPYFTTDSAAAFARVGDQRPTSF